MTAALYATDAYLRECQATVTAVLEDGVVLDRTVFYPLSGGQPGDTGRLRRESGEVIEVIDTRYGANGEIVHRTAPGPQPAPGERVLAQIDWERRHRHMRMHTSLHLLGALIPAGVTGGNIAETRSRLDFDTADIPDKATLTAQLNALVAADHPVRSRWITQEELAAQPELIRTMSVQPPTHVPRIRLLEIPGVDLQPCGGTHVSRTGEIGRLEVGKIENKGKHNRRVHVLLLDPSPPRAARCDRNEPPTRRHHMVDEETLSESDRRELDRRPRGGLGSAKC